MPKCMVRPEKNPKFPTGKCFVFKILNEKCWFLIGRLFLMQKQWRAHFGVVSIWGRCIQAISGSAVLYWVKIWLLGVKNGEFKFWIFFTLTFFFDILRTTWVKKRWKFFLVDFSFEGNDRSKVLLIRFPKLCRMPSNSFSITHISLLRLIVTVGQSHCCNTFAMDNVTCTVSYMIVW